MLIPLDEKNITTEVGSAQLWKLNEDSELENKYTFSWDFEDNSWTLPSTDVEGYITDLSSGQVLTVKGSKVELKDKNETCIQQKWIRSKPDSEGWCTLKNPSSDKFLASNITQDNEEEEETLTVEGKIQYCLIEIHQQPLYEEG